MALSSWSLFANLIYKLGMAAPLYISADMVKDLVCMKDIIEVVGKAMESICPGEVEGGVVQPVRTAVPVRKQDG